VYVRVSASNLFGTSTYSPIGDGASIWLQPDAPTNLANNEAVTDDIVIGLSWNPGLSDGGTPLIDYRLWYALETEDYTVLEEN
jgi:hypothetical protein